MVSKRVIMPLSVRYSKVSALAPFHFRIQGPVKCIATSAPFIASGGADDTVHIYNAKVE